MSNPLLILVHPFYHHRKVLETLAREGTPWDELPCSKAHPYLSALTAALRNQETPILLLEETKQRASTDHLLRFLKASASYVVIETGKDTPRPQADWKVLWKFLEIQGAQKIMLGGGYYNDWPQEDGCARMTEEELQKQGYEIELQRGLLFGGQRIRGKLDFYPLGKDVTA